MFASFILMVKFMVWAVHAPLWILVGQFVSVQDMLLVERGMHLMVYWEKFGYTTEF